VQSSGTPWFTTGVCTSRDVTVKTPLLGALVNRVDRSDRIAPWTFGVAALMQNLGARGLLAPSDARASSH